MLKKSFLFAAMALLIVTVSIAQDIISGHWVGKVMDTYDLVYDLKAEGNKLSGTVNGATLDGKPAPITDGVIKGDSVFFKTPSQSGEILFVKGKVKDDVLSIAFTAMGFDVAADLKKTAK